MNGKKRIVVATGGTGGHVIPSLALCNFLKDTYELKIITDLRGSKYLGNIKDIDIKKINIETLYQKNFLKVFLSILKIILSIFTSFTYLLFLRPKIIFGMGGYSSFPVCIAGILLNIPIIIYENNLIVGRANKFLLHFAKKILVSNNNLDGISSKHIHKKFFCGYIIRDEILRVKSKNIIKNDEIINLLIIGGSQSAKVFGEEITKVILHCNENNIKFNIFQQCLESQKKDLDNLYKKQNIKFQLFSFTDNMNEYYKFIDLAITRSGASSIAELVNLSIPFISIPLPSSKDDHQYKNALHFKKKGYCLLLQQEFIPTKLFEILADLNKNREKLSQFKNAMKEHSDKDVFKKIKNLIKEIL